jgi:hypothetical protein
MNFSGQPATSLGNTTFLISAYLWQVRSMFCTVPFVRNAIFCVYPSKVYLFSLFVSLLYVEAVHFPAVVLHLRFVCIGAGLTVFRFVLYHIYRFGCLVLWLLPFLLLILLLDINSYHLLAINA